MGFLKSLFGLGDQSQNLDIAYPAPDANGAQYQKEALDDLYKVDCMFKFESVINEIALFKRKHF